MLISKFVGGLYNARAKHLVPTSAGVEVVNADINYGSIKSLGKFQKVGSALKPGIHWYKGNIVSEDEGTIYTEMLDCLFVANQDGMKCTQDGVNFHNVGIPAPTLPPTCVPTGTGTGFSTNNVQYCYTYVNINLGMESPPSPVSTVGNVTNQGVRVTIPMSDNPDVTHIILYRSDSSLNTFAEVPFPSLIGNSAISIVDSYQPKEFYNRLTSFGLSILPKCSIVTASNGVLWCAGYIHDIMEKKDKLFSKKMLYFSVPESPFLWNAATNWIEFDDEITGIAPTSSGVLVFTRGRTYLIQGSTISNMVKFLAYDGIGCESPNSVAIAYGEPMWMAADGIYTYRGGYSVVNVTKDKVPAAYFRDKPLSSCVINGAYHLVFKDRILVVNPYLNYACYEYKLGATGLSHDGATYYFYVNGDIMTLDSEPGQTLKYKTGWLTEGTVSNLKNYNIFYVFASGDLTCRIYIEGKLAADVKLKDGVATQIKVAQQYRQGYYAEVEFEGVGEIHEIQYSPEGRQQRGGR